MTLVAWILALVGAVLAFALAAGSTAGLVRRMDTASALAVTPLPTLAVYFSAPDLYAGIQAGTPLRALLFPGGPCVIGCVTLLGVILSLRQQVRGPGGWR
jgi:hypothetical protein